MYIILWKENKTHKPSGWTDNWTALHSVFNTQQEAEDWLEEYKKEYGGHYEYKLARLTFLD